MTAVSVLPFSSAESPRLSRDARGRAASARRGPPRTSRRRAAARSASRAPEPGRARAAARVHRRGAREQQGRSRRVLARRRPRARRCPERSRSREALRSRPPWTRARRRWGFRVGRRSGERRLRGARIGGERGRGRCRRVGGQRVRRERSGRGDRDRRWSRLGAQPLEENGDRHRGGHGGDQRHRDHRQQRRPRRVQQQARRVGLFQLALARLGAAAILDQLAQVLLQAQEPGGLLGALGLLRRLEQRQPLAELRQPHVAFSCTRSRASTLSCSCRKSASAAAFCARSSQRLTRASSAASSPRSSGGGEFGSITETASNSCCRSPKRSRRSWAIATRTTSPSSPRSARDRARSAAAAAASR